MTIARSMRIHILAIVLCLSFTGARSLAEDETGQLSQVARGRSLLEDHKPAEALRQFLQVAPSSEEYVQSLAGIILANLALREPQGAMAASEELARQAGQDSECQKARGLLVLTLDRQHAKRALAPLQTAYTLTPTDNTLFLLAGCHATMAMPNQQPPLSGEARLEQLQFAIQCCNELISRNKEDYRYFLLRGYCLYERGDTDSALADLLQAEPGIPSEDAQQHRQFIAYAALHGAEQIFSPSTGSRDKCLEYLNLAISKCPYWARLYFFRGVIRSEYLDDPRGAISDYSLAIELQPKSDRNYLFRACVYLELLILDKAMDDIETAFELCDTPSELHYLTRAEIALRDRRYEEAVADCTDAIRLQSSESSRVYFVRALAREALRQKEAASTDRAKGMSVLSLQPGTSASPEQLKEWRRLAPTAEKKCNVNFFVFPLGELVGPLRAVLYGK